MQNELGQLFSDLSPQTLGMTDPFSIWAMSLLAPGFVMFAILFMLRSMRPRWRGYWDAV
jgi:hypothetical protein